MKLLHRLFARNDRRRARDCLQQICDERVAARRALDKVNRAADRALREAAEIEREQFRAAFFGLRDPVHTAFFVTSAELFGVITPTPFEVDGGAYFRAAVARRRAQKVLKCAA